MALLLLLVGLLVAGWGALAATSPSRPRDLVGALAAPVGLALALAGGVALLVPGFLSGT